MKVLDYGLHDTKLNNLETKELGVVLYFDNGIYSLDNGKETNLTESCKIEIEIECFSKFKTFEHIEIFAIHKNKIKEISIDEFSKMLQKAAFDIVMDYISTFSNALLLKGFIGKYKIELKISDIKNIKFLF